MEAKCGQTTPIWWEIWGSKTPKVSCTKLGMLFQNDVLMPKLKELTKIYGGQSVVRPPQTDNYCLASY